MTLFTGLRPETHTAIDPVCQRQRLDRCRKSPLIDNDFATRFAKRGPGRTRSGVVIDLADVLEKRCTQAIALASLLMETDADDAVADTAWVLRDLIEEIRVTGRMLQQSLPMTE